MPRPSSGESHKSLRRDRPRHSHTGLSTKNHGGASKGGAGGKYTWGSPQDDVHVASRSIVGSSASAFSSSSSSSAAAAAAAGSGDLVPVADDSEEPALSSSSDQQPLSTSDESSSVPDVAYRVLTVEEHDEAHATPRARFHGSPLDKRDGFFHLSVADEVLGTLKRYYGQHPRVVAVKYNLNRLNRRGRRRRASSGSSSSSSSSDDDDDSSSSDDESAEDGSLVYWQRVATRNNALFPHYYGKHLPLKGRTVLAVHHLHRDEATGEFHLPHDF